MMFMYVYMLRLRREEEKKRKERKKKKKEKKTLTRHGYSDKIVYSLCLSISSISISAGSFSTRVITLYAQ